MILFDVSDIVAIIGISANILCVIIIASYIQSSQVASRSLKDFYIKEVNDLLQQINNQLSLLVRQSGKPKSIQHEFKNYVSRLNNLDIVLNKQYNVSVNPIIIKYLELQKELEDSEVFTQNYKSNKGISLTDHLIEVCNEFRYDFFEKRMYEVIIDVNNFKFSYFKFFKK